MGSLETIPDIPVNIDPGLFAHLKAMKNAMLNLQASVIPPDPPTNFKVTPAPGANLIQFTRSNGTGYSVYVNTVPSLNGATRYDLGNSNSYTHNVGKAGVALYYYVVALIGQLVSNPAGPILSTTAALNAVITLPIAPPASQTPTTSNETGNEVPGVPSGQQYQVDL